MKLQYHPRINAVAFAFSVFVSCNVSYGQVFTPGELTPAILGPYNWDSTFRGPVSMMPVSSYVCTLTRVTGKFLGGGEKIRVYGDRNSGWWWLGDQGIQWIGGSAYCFNLSVFTGASPTSRWVSNEFSTSYQVHDPGGFSEYGPGYIYTWWGDAATMLTGLSGQFDGGGEAVGIWQNPWPFYPSYLFANSEAVNPIWGFAQALFVGVPSSGLPARFYGPNAVGGARTAGEYTVNNSGQVFMAPKNSAMCYFTKIQGMFRGGGEFAEITTDWDAYGTERWVLRTGSQQNGITASARCFLFNQAQK